MDGVSPPPLSDAELGQLIRQHRTSRGLTQIEVIDRAKAALGGNVMSEPTYRAVESGRTHASERTLVAVARGLDLPAQTFVDARAGRDPEPEPDALAAWKGELANVTEEEAAQVLAYLAGLRAARAK